jgi:hypothetical protein
MREIWAAGGSPYMSNFYGEGRQGVWFTTSSGQRWFKRVPDGKSMARSVGGPVL